MELNNLAQMNFSSNSISSQNNVIPLKQKKEEKALFENISQHVLSGELECIKREIRSVKKQKDYIQTEIHLSSHQREVLEDILNNKEPREHQISQNLLQTFKQIRNLIQNDTITYKNGQIKLNKEQRKLLNQIDFKPQVEVKPIKTNFSDNLNAVFYVKNTNEVKSAELD